MKKITRRLLYPGTIWTILLIILCTAALVYIFITEQQETIISYIVYTISVYSLTISAINAPKTAKKIKAIINKNKLVSRYLTDIPYRVKVSLYTSLLLNLIYAVFKLVAGIHYASFWYGADALYYIILSAAGFLLLRYVRKDECDIKTALKSYRLCGYMLFTLNAALAGVVYQIINQGMGYKYPGLLIYAVATFTFYCITVSVVNVIKYRKYKNPVYSAQKAISFTKALVAMFALQTAMFASFNDDEVLESTMNLIFGIAVCFVIFCLAAYMVIRANKELEKLEI